MLDDEKIISVLLHEMRSPINIILGVVAQAKKQINCQVYIEESLDRINSVANYLLSLSNNYLDIIKNEKILLNSNITAFSIHDLIDYIKSIFEFQANILDLEFKVDRNKVANISILCDEIILKQILINLISNAFKYTPKHGSVTLTCETEEIDQEFVELSFIVTDTGIGMNEKFLEKLFTPFTQEKELAKPKGTGLGLAIAKKQIDSLNGNISVKSIPHQGTTFTFKFKAQVVKTDYDFSNEHILIIDDCDITKAVLKDFLKDTGAIVDLTSDGNIGFNMYYHSPDNYYSTIIVDKNLGNMCGDDIAHKIRISNRVDAKNITILGVSSCCLASDRFKGLSSGMNECLVKPITRSMLLQTIQKFHKDV